MREMETNRPGSVLRRDGQRGRTGQVRLASGQRGKDRGKLNTENGAAGLGVVTHDFSGVLLNDPKTDTQAETRSLSDRFRCVKGIENTMWFF